MSMTRIRVVSCLAVIALVKHRCVRPVKPGVKYRAATQKSPRIIAPDTTKCLKIIEQNRQKQSILCKGQVPHVWLYRKLLLAEHGGITRVTLLHALKQNRTP